MRTLTAGLLLLIACSSDGTGPDDAAELRTDKAAYYIGNTIRVRLENGLDEPLFVPHCNDRLLMIVEYRVNNEWVLHNQLNGPACLGIYPAGEARIDPNRSRTDSLTLEAAGDFRIRMYARRAGEDFGGTVLETAAFTVRYPPD